MTGRRVYSLSPRRKALLAGLWVALCVPLAIWGALIRDSALLITAALVAVVLAPIFVVSGWYYPKLILTEEGIERRNIGYRLRASWENIETARWKRGIEGLILRRPMADKGAFRFAATATARFDGVHMYDPEVIKLIRERRFIPLEAFAYWGCHGDLHQEIERRVPSSASTDS